MNDLKQSVILTIEKIIRESRGPEWAAAAAADHTTPENLAATLIYARFFETPIIEATKGITR